MLNYDFVVSFSVLFLGVGMGWAWFLVDHGRPSPQVSALEAAAKTEREPRGEIALLDFENKERGGSSPFLQDKIRYDVEPLWDAHVVSL